MKENVYKTKHLSLDKWADLNYSQNKISGFDLQEETPPVVVPRARWEL